MKIDCFTCKYGYEDEQLGIPMCHHPRRFSEDCVNFNMHEEKEIKESENPFKEPIDGVLYAVTCGIKNKEQIEESEKPVHADLEEAVEEYEKKHTYQRYDGGGLTPEYDATLAEAFIAGHNLCREKIIKEAVECDVMLTLHDKTGDISLHTGFLPKELGIKYGDKVHIIIVNEDSHE